MKTGGNPDAAACAQWERGVITTARPKEPTVHTDNAFLYVETEIPPGMTVHEWRCSPARRSRRSRLTAFGPKLRLRRAHPAARAAR